MSTENSIKIKKFEGKDFNFWKGKVLNSLMFLGLDNYLTVKPDTSKPAEVAADKKTIAFIKDSLSDNLFRRYNETTAKDLWEKIKADFEKLDAQMLFVLRNKFLSCKKNRNESMSDYINRLTTWKHELDDADNKVSDSDYILTIMNGTHDEYGDFVSAMTAKKEINNIVVNDLINQLIKEDDLRRTMKHHENKSTVGSNDRKVLMVKDGKNSKNNKKSNKKLRKCYNCGIPGHYANECKRPKSKVTNVTKGKEYACITDDTNTTNQQRICIIEEKQCESNKWLLDSGASTHACNSSSMFEEIKPEKTSIIVGDNREVTVTGRGTVKLKVKANNVVNTLVLNNVALVPELSVNLVSTGRLESHGLKIVCENGKSNILLKNTLIGYAIRTKENPYLYEFENCESSSEHVYVTNSPNNSSWSLWHRRLGHLSNNYMSKLNSKEFTNSTETESCEECNLSKATKLPHIKKTQDIIDQERKKGSRKGVIHSDLMGPMRHKSLSGSRYVLTYIDSHTDYSFIYLLKNKSEQYIMTWYTTIVTFTKFFIRFFIVF